jgi:hypothetical protein
MDWFLTLLALGFIICAIVFLSQWYPGMAFLCGGAGLFVRYLYKLHEANQYKIKGEERK